MSQIDTMLYHIVGFWPQEGPSGSGFGIKLYPKWKESVMKSGLTQDNITSMIEKLGNVWLDAYGYDEPFVYEGKTSRLYEAKQCLRISWGEWGPEHITVPGDACGLDITDGGVVAPKGGKFLSPHNVDHIRQAGLLLTVFLYIADELVHHIEEDS